MKTDDYTSNLEAWIKKEILALECFQHYWHAQNGNGGHYKAPEAWEHHFREWIQKDDKPQNPFV